MKKPVLGVSLSSAGLVLGACFGCLARQDLSSYSEGPSPSTVEPLGSGESPSGNPSDAAAPMPGADEDDLETSASEVSAEGQDPGDVSLDSAGEPVDPADDPTDSTDVASDPGPAVPEPTIAGETCTGPGEFTNLGASSCYRLGELTSSALLARESCQAWGGDLVAIGSAAEHALLAARSTEDTWIGANDLAVEGVFRWPDGSALVFTRWAIAQPDNYLDEDCAELRAVDDLWNDVPCTGDKRTLCEKPLPESGSGG